MKLRNLICFCIIILSCTVHGNLIEDNLLTFEIQDDDSSLELCQGLRVTGRHIATSPDCVTAVKKRLDSGHVFIRNFNGIVNYQIENINNDFYFDALSRLGSNLLLPIKGGQVIGDEDIFFYIRSRITTSETIVAFINDKHTTEFRQITLNSIGHDSGNKKFRIYNVVAEANFPSGSVVINHDNEIICFISSDNLCYEPDFQLDITDRQKRSSDSLCQVKHFQCSNASFTTCLPNGNGEGECTNDHTGERCGLGTYPNGFSANYQGQNLYCNNADGCEVVVCPSSCATGSSSCSCRAVYKLNDLSHTIPCNCIFFSDSSVPCGNQNPGGGHKGLTHTEATVIGFAVPAGVTITVVATIFLVYYYITNKKARSNPVGGGALISSEHL